MLVNGQATRVAPIPIPAQPPAIGRQQNSQRQHQERESKEEDKDGLTPLHFTDTSRNRKQQTHVTLRGDSEDQASPDGQARGESAKPQERHDYLRSDGYTSVCGVYSPAQSIPMKRDNRGNGEFCCPRCESNFTRPKTVKDHFYTCVSKYGNPQALRFTDHFSMAATEAFIQHGVRASRGASSVNAEGDGRHVRAHSQEVKFEEMNEALYVDLVPVNLCVVTDFT